MKWRTKLGIHRWSQNDSQSLKQPRKGALLFFRVIYQFSRSHGTKITDFNPIWAFPDWKLVWVHRWLWNDTQSLKQPTAGVLLFFKDICQILKLCGLEIADLDPILGRSQLSNPSGLPFYVSFTGSFQHGQASVRSLLWPNPGLLLHAVWSHPVQAVRHSNTRNLGILYFLSVMSVRSNLD